MENQTSNQPSTLVDGVLETVDAVFIATKKIVPEKVFRLEVAGLRHYLRASNKRAYKSLTTFLSSIVKENKYLETWRDQVLESYGKEGHDVFMDAVAEYGTALHIAVASFCINGQVDWQGFKLWAHDYLQGIGLLGSAKDMALSELVNDFAAMVQFISDYNVKILAVEVPVFLSSGIATLIDIVCEMDCKLYVSTAPEKRKRHTAIINLKSGKKGFFETHVLQLEGERRMLAQTHGIRAKAVYNLAPKSWRGDSPTYSIKDQTKACAGIRSEFDLYLKLGAMKGILKEPTREFKMYNGVTQYGESPKPCISTIKYNEFAYARIDAQMAAITGIEQ